LELSKHDQSREYWRTAKTTFLTSPEFYDKQAQLYVDTFIPELGHLDLTIDLGCGNGRFTEMLSQVSNATIGVDVGPRLLTEARASAMQKGLRGLAYVESALENYDLPSGCSLISCTGVTCCLIDDDVFYSLCQRMDKALKSGGYLLLKDTLSMGPEDSYWEGGGYIGRYRTVERYFAHFSASSRDWQIVASEILSDSPEIERRNYITLLRVSGA
jgi:SAM-dependent methyltransferase